ncbi:imidazole glycerol phosphate synthase subunit HisH [soil metagenome]
MVAIIDYNAGNTQSVIFALQRLGVEPVLTRDVEQLRQADKVIFPGVGEASSTMAFLTDLGLHEIIPTLTQPVLGVCLGMQLMCEYSDEGNTAGIGIFPHRALKFEPEGGLKVPHMGWDNIIRLSGDLFTPEMENDYAYFVHSYYVPLGSDMAAACDYIMPFSAALQKDNFYGVQFHPEKSGPLGERILKNFLEL